MSDRSMLTLDNLNISNVENNTSSSNRFKLVRIPKQDFKLNKAPSTPIINIEIVNEIKEVFDLFAVDGYVNPHDIKEGLRSVSKKLLARN